MGDVAASDKTKNSQRMLIFSCNFHPYLDLGLCVYLLKQPVMRCDANEHDIVRKRGLIEAGPQSPPSLLDDGAQTRDLNGLDEMLCELDGVPNHERPKADVDWRGAFGYKDSFRLLGFKFKSNGII